MMQMEMCQKDAVANCEAKLFLSEMHITIVEYCSDSSGKLLAIVASINVAYNLAGQRMVH